MCIAGIFVVSQMLAMCHWNKCCITAFDSGMSC